MRRAVPPQHWYYCLELLLHRLSLMQLPGSPQRPRRLPGAPLAAAPGQRPRCPVHLAGAGCSPAPCRRLPAAPSCAGPVLVDIPKDVQQTLDIPDWDAPMSITAYMSRLPPPPQEAQLQVTAICQYMCSALGVGLTSVGRREAAECRRWVQRMVACRASISLGFFVACCACCSSGSSSRTAKC